MNEGFRGEKPFLKESVDIKSSALGPNFSSLRGDIVNGEEAKANWRNVERRPASELAGKIELKGHSDGRTCS